LQTDELTRPTAQRQKTMESTFYLKATDRQAQTLFDSTLATVKLMEFMGDKEQYPEMDMNSDVIHKWKVTLRHRDEIGEIKGSKTFQRVMQLISH
jgi:hypothetical protein